MICVSIGRTRHSAVTEEHRRLAEIKAELVELRIDWLRKRPDVGRLLADRPTPVVLTCRRREDRGRWSGTEEQRLAVLREAIVAGVEYVDLEEDIAGRIPRYGKTKRIVSYHNFDETPIELFDIYQRLADCDPDIIKIVTMANVPSDNVRILELVENSEVPTVGFCMGELGTLSRILCGRYGSPFTYASFSRDREMAPGQLSFAQVKHLYGFDRITHDTKVFGVIGDPIAHSRSPLIHNAAFRKLGVDAVYLGLRVPRDVLVDTLEEFDRLSVSGYSVTIPHKEDVIDFASEVDDSTQQIGAANTLLMRDDKWIATNTDYDAALGAVLDGLAASPTHTPDLAAKSVLILGAGGVARAVALAMRKSGAKLLISNRNRERGQALAAEFGGQFLSWANRASEFADVLINCTSVGMHPNVDETPYEANWIRDNSVVFDTVYTPENTLLLKYARERGCTVITGVDMFIRQAAKQFELFTGLPAPADYMAETLRRATSAAR